MKISDKSTVPLIYWILSLYFIHLFSFSDINECQDKVCSQHCGNIPGSYNCSCDEGYNLENSRLCIANG